MKKFLCIASGAMLLMTGVTLSYGQVIDPNGGHHSGKKIELLLRDHEERIRGGMHDGSLTREESDRLRAKEDSIRVKLDDFRTKNHGFLTNNEESNLEASMDEISGEIYRARRNAASQ